MKMNKTVALRRARRGGRVRNKLRNSGRIRLSVHRTNCHIYCQLIDDTAGVTLASASSCDPKIIGDGVSGGNCDAAFKVGRAIAERALAKGIQSVCFDRGAFKYHGRVGKVAQAAREAGLQF